jgi:hypothetical protein
MNSKKIIQDDILRYKKNKFASSFALLGLVFTALYFMLLYSFNNRFFYSLPMGISVMLTLVLLLTAFLSSESIKNYRKTYCIVLLVLAAINIIRIFYYPLKGLQNDVLQGVYFARPLSSTASFVILTIFLVASAACYVVSAVFGYINAERLAKHTAAVEKGTISVEAALKELDEAEASAQVANENVNSKEVK